MVESFRQGFKTNVRLKQLNKSRRSLLAEHKDSVLRALERHDEAHRDRNGDGAVQVLNRLLFERTQPVDIHDAPEHDTAGSLQSVKIFRPLTMAEMLHPDAHEFFCPDELSEVVDQAAEINVRYPGHYRHIDYVENSEHGALVGFMTEAQDRANREYERKISDRNAKRKRRAERAGYKVEQDLASPVDPDEAKKARAEAEKWANCYRERSAEIADRLEYGFFSPGGKVAGEIVEKFSEYFGPGILRSLLGSPSLARMAALYPRVGELRAGYDKGALLTSTTKLFALDAPYVELNRKIAGCIVVELDTVLRVKELREKLLKILGPYRMPNLIVGRVTADGFLSRPHLIWILKDPVWYEPYSEWVDSETGEVRSSGDKRCKPKPIKKLHHIQRGLTQLLLPLGADPGCHNIWKPKNPLSPFWSVFVLNDDNWHELNDFDQIPGWPQNVDEHSLAEEAAKMRAAATGADLTTSNLAWKTIGHVIEPLARLQLSVRDEDFIVAGKSVETLTIWFEAKVRPAVEAEIPPSDGLDRIIHGRCAFAARYCIGKLMKPRRKGRGRDRDLIFSDLSPADRRKQAGARTDAHKRAVSLWNLQKEMWVAVRESGAIRRPDFMKSLWSVRKSTAYKLWDEACDKLGLEFRDGAYRKKAKPTPGVTNQSSFLPGLTQSSDSKVSVQVIPGQQVIPLDSESPILITVPPEVGPPEPPRQIHHQSAADLRLLVAIRVVEPA